MVDSGQLTRLGTCPTRRSSDLAATSQNKATLTSPSPGSTLAGATVSFGWSAGTGATEYWLEVGTTGVGSTNLYSQSQGLNRSGKVNVVHTKGRVVYVRRWTLLGRW